MDTLFLLCAIFGGTILVAQSVLGLGGGDDIDLDDVQGDDGGHDHAVGDGHHGSTWFFGVLSFRTIIIGVTFFGLIGKAASASQWEQPSPLVAAIVGGIGSMYAVYFLMRALYQLNADGTQQISRAVGLEGTVYLSIPAQQQGVGKIHLNLQNRLVEYEAQTAGERLPSGSNIIVVGVIGPDRVEVAPLPVPSQEPA